MQISRTQNKNRTGPGKAPGRFYFICNMKLMAGSGTRHFYEITSMMLSVLGMICTLYMS